MKSRLDVSNEARNSRFSVALLALTATFAAGCSKVPVTGRKQYNLVPEKLMIQLGASSYESTLAEQTTLKGSDDHKTLKSVGKRIASVANKDDYSWAYSLIDDDETINAWCMPGGKIAFYTGILPVLESEAGMSFVMGHEVGHAVAHHGAERLSQQLTAIGGLGALYLFLEKKTELDDTQKGLVLGAMGVGATVGVILPFSRKHEKEADVIGMMYMAKAGYPPGESIKVWDRMEAETGGSSLPAFVSTHPSNENRQGNLKDWLPQAKKRYQRNKLDRDTQAALWTDKGSSSGSSSSDQPKTLSITSD